MVKIKKRDGRIENFIQSKMESSIEKAGATVEQAKEVTKTVAAKIAEMVEVSTALLSDYVVAALRKINKKAAEAYVAYEKKKLALKAKKK
jgi:transcriptional regulator NrdR family protein